MKDEVRAASASSSLVCRLSPLPLFLGVLRVLGGKAFQIIRLRIAVTTISATITTAKIANIISATRSH